MYSTYTLTPRLSRALILVPPELPLVDWPQAIQPKVQSFTYAASSRLVTGAEIPPKRSVRDWSPF